MPCLKIVTNLPKAKIPVDFVNQIISVLSKSVKKEPEKFVCIITADSPVSFGGESTKPGAVATLESIGNLGINENKVIAREVSAFVEKELGIHRDRFFLTFYDVVHYNVAKGGLTIAAVEPQ